MGKSNNRSSKPKLSKYEAPKQRRITKEQIENATYKDVKLLEKFLSELLSLILLFLANFDVQIFKKEIDPLLI